MGRPLRVELCLYCIEIPVRPIHAPRNRGIDTPPTSRRALSRWRNRERRTRLTTTASELTDIHDSKLDLDQIPKVVAEGVKKVKGDSDRMRQWAATPLGHDALVPWFNKDVSDAWGKKAACRVFHICKGGHDVEFDDAFASGEATEKPVKRTARVPGSPAPATNLFDVSQAMSWVATGRNNPDERLEWQTGIPRLVGRLAEMVGSR